jgi:hypothetical protein
MCAPGRAERQHATSRAALERWRLHTDASAQPSQRTAVATFAALPDRASMRMRACLLRRARCPCLYTTQQLRSVAVQQARRSAARVQALTCTAEPEPVQQRVEANEAETAMTRCRAGNGQRRASRETMKAEVAVVEFKVICRLHELAEHLHPELARRLDNDRARHRCVGRWDISRVVKRLRDRREREAA